jgi:hypothetical protein
MEREGGEEWDEAIERIEAMGLRGWLHEYYSKHCPEKTALNIKSVAKQ